MGARNLINRLAAWFRLRPNAEGGNVAVIFALALPMVIGGLGYGIETSYWYLVRVSMQNTADMAAYAAAAEARNGADKVELQDAALQSAIENGFSAAGGVAVTAPGAGGPNSVEVTLTRNLDRVFTAFFVADKVNLSASAMAAYAASSNACLLALSPSGSGAVTFSGSSAVQLSGCSVMANSVANDGVIVKGSSTLTVDCLISAGGVDATAGLTLTACDNPITQAAPVADPFRKVPAPALTGPCKNDNGNTLTPGRFCSGMTLKNNVHLEPGVYIIEGGDFRVNANANITGAGVTFYLTSGSHLSFNGNAQINLSAPTSGIYSGMLIFGQRNATGSNTINGTAGSTLTGAIYFKSQEVSYLGNFSGSGGCTQVVAAKVEWSGNTSLAADCSALGMKTIPATSIVKLTG